MTMNKRLVGLALSGLMVAGTAAAAPKAEVKEAAKATTTVATADATEGVRVKTIPTDGSNAINMDYFKLQMPANAGPNDAHLEVHMDMRYMGGSGIVEAKVPALAPAGLDYQRTKTMLSTIRTRMWLQGTIDENLKVTGVIKDSRSLRTDGVDSDRTAYLERAYANYNRDKLGITAGRFYYWIDDGNVYEEVMDGARFKYGTPETYGAITLGQMKDYYQEGGPEMRGYILQGSHRINKWEEQVSYYNFKGRDGVANAFDQQQILSARTRYYLGNASSVGWEYLYGKGNNRSGIAGMADGDNANGHGMVWSLNFGDEWSNPSVKGSYCLHLRYYDQPRSTYIKHTMSGLPQIFSHNLGFEGFKGFGLYSEYVIVPGISVMVEAYDLKEKGSGHSNPDFGGESAATARERVIGAALNFYF